MKGASACKLPAELALHVLPYLLCRPSEPRLLPQRLALESPTLEAAAATGAGAAQLAAWVAEDRLLLVAGIDNSSSELLVELAVDSAAGMAREVAAMDSGVPPLLACCSRPGPGGGALLQQHSGALLMYTPGGTLRTLPAAAGFPCGCQQMAATPPAVVEQADGTAPAAFGLSGRGQLYWGSRQLATDVTSFAVRAAADRCGMQLFLLLTDSNRLELYFMGPPARRADLSAFHCLPAGSAQRPGGSLPAVHHAAASAAHCVCGQPGGWEFCRAACGQWSGGRAARTSAGPAAAGSGRRNPGFQGSHEGGDAAHRRRSCSGSRWRQCAQH